MFEMEMAGRECGSSGRERRGGGGGGGGEGGERGTRSAAAPSLVPPREANGTHLKQPERLDIVPLVQREAVVDSCRED